MVDKYLVPRADAIRNKRRLRGFTLRTLSIATGQASLDRKRVARGHLGRIERGEAPAVYTSTARKIAAAIAGPEASPQDIDLVMVELFEFPKETAKEDASVR